MDEREHPDAVDRLRASLPGTRRARALRAPDPDAQIAAAHAAGCPECASERDLIARAADLVRAAGEGPSEDARDAVARAIRDAEPAEPFDETAVSWVTAASAADALGVRGALRPDGIVRWEDSELRLDAYLHPTGAPGRFDVSGQVLAGGGRPAADVEVTLYLDRSPVGAVRTDAFGEFTLQPGRARHGARRVGLRLRGAGEARHVELWDADGAPR